MSKLANIALMQALLGGSSPYKPMRKCESKSPKSKHKEAKPSAKVIYYTDENGQIKRKKVSLEETE